VPHDHPFWERMLPALRGSDPDEVTRQLRHQLQAEPFRITARHWLAEIHRRDGNVALAIGQYDRLLPLAVGAGDVFRTLAIQKRLDELDERPGVEDRFRAIHRWFRLLGIGHLVEAPSTSGAGLSARSLIHLPGDAFVHAASHATIESFMGEARQLELEGAEQFVVLWGEIVWDVRLLDGRRRREQRAVEGDLLRVDPEFASRGRMRVRPDTPAECLRFGGRLLAQLTSVDPGIVGVSPFGAADLVREERVMLPTKPRTNDDMDRRPQVPERRAPAGPPRLDLDGRPAPVTAGADDDIESWVGYGSLTLDPRPIDLSPAFEAPAAGDIPMLDLDAAGRTPRRGRPMVEAPGSLELGDGMVVPVARDPFAAPAGDIGTPIERRGGDRAACEIGGRVRLMGIAGAPHAAMDCRVFDLSPGGVGVVFAREDIARAIAILEGEILRVELDLPQGSPLSVAARMRWVDLDEPTLVRAGLQFVMLAPGDETLIQRVAGVPAASPAER